MALSHSPFGKFKLVSGSLALLVVLLGLAGCGSGIDGTYTSSGGMGIIESMTFKKGGKVEVTAMGMTKEGTFEVEGKKVKVTIANDTTILTLDDNGCLNGGGMIGKFCKGTASTAGGKRSDAGGSAPSKANGLSPSGVYESRMPDGTIFTLNFQKTGKVTMTMTENGKPDVQEANWVVNGDTIMVQSPEGLPLQLRPNGSAMVAEMGGMQITFTRK
jgi:hypothetical protein